MSVSLPLVLVIVVVAVVVGVLLGRRGGGGDTVRSFPESGVRMIRPPAPVVRPTSDVSVGGREDPSPTALADAINRATEAANVRLHITPEMLANAKITSNVSVSTNNGTLDPAEARQIMDAVSRAMAGQGTQATGSALSPAVEAEIRALVARGHMIEAVKRVRDATGLGLKESKDIAEAMR